VGRDFVGSEQERCKNPADTPSDFEPRLSILERNATPPVDENSSIGWQIGHQATEFEGFKE